MRKCPARLLESLVIARAQPSGPRGEGPGVSSVQTGGSHKALGGLPGPCAWNRFKSFQGLRVLFMSSLVGGEKKLKSNMSQPSLFRTRIQLASFQLDGISPPSLGHKNPRARKGRFEGSPHDPQAKHRLAPEKRLNSRLCSSDAVSF